MTASEEIERKYEVDDAARVPSLDGIAAIGEVSQADLDAEYFDTVDGALAAHRIVLRRRRGGADEGWHIKYPTGQGRTELHWPLSDGDVPEEVIAPVLARVRGRELSVVARLRTRRGILRLVGEDGEPLLELVDDVVSATDVGSGTERNWREWECEVLDGAPRKAKARTALLDAVEKRLIDAGARPATSESKLASALGRTSLGVERPAPALDRTTPASDLLLVPLRVLVDDIALVDARVRTNEPDSVHQLRTRLRRLRSLFASYRVVFDRAATDPLRAQLQRFGLVLGEARDAEVMRDRAESLVSDHDPVSRGVAGRLLAGWSSAYDAAHARVVTEMSGEGYFALLDALEAFLANPALAKAASEPAEKVIPRVLEKERKSVLRLAREAEAATTPAARIESLHGTRKAAKRLRYSAEAVSRGDAGVFGKSVVRLAGAAEAIHDLLGEHRDSTVMQDYLRENAGTGKQAFDYGVLCEVERHGAALCLAEYPAALRVLKNRKKPR